uniref:centrosomal protein CCDC61-like n=1 Tax=Jaculus jaculus TaxID=51337 RepID=UPI001E1B1128|nr:centrosomal protein CCDC61-like [Jaculus jaculus]
MTGTAGVWSSRGLQSRPVLLPLLRIHYPLPLPYQGKPDPVVLQGIIRTLKEELGRLRGLDRGQNPRDTRETEIWHLREQVSRLAAEKRELEAQLGRSREEALAGRAARQEAEALRGLVRSLELELRQERGLGSRGVARRGQDCRRLAKELEEAKASERSLRARLKTLSGELALCKRGSRALPMGPAPAREDRASSSRERSTSRGRGATRSSSRESGRGVRGRGRPARPSPSPSGGRAPRFDPTAFVKAKEKKQREIRVKQQQQRHRLGSGGSGDGPSVSWSRQTRPPAAVTGRGDAASGSRHRSSSVDSFRSRCSSASSCSEFEDFSESLSRGPRCGRGKPPSPSPWSGSSPKSTAPLLEDRVAGGRTVGAEAEAGTISGAISRRCRASLAVVRPTLNGFVELVSWGERLLHVAVSLHLILGSQEPPSHATVQQLQVPATGCRVLRATRSQNSTGVLCLLRPGPPHRPVCVLWKPDVT